MQEDNSMQNKDIEKLFKQRQDARVELIKESIEDLRSGIVSRDQLHKEMMASFDKVDNNLNNSMPKLDVGSTGHMHELFKELTKKKFELEELRIQEKLNVWRDKAALKKELREHMKELRDIESKMSMIDNILGL
jgi:exonuclease VII large subunit